MRQPSSDWNASGVPFSIAGWVFCPAGISNIPILMKNNDGNSGFHSPGTNLQFNWAGTTMNTASPLVLFSLFDGSGTGSASISYAPGVAMDNAWHFFVIASTGTTLKMSVDGSDLDTGITPVSIGGVVPESDSGLFIVLTADNSGRSPDGGKFDQFCWWNRALTAIEVTRLYNGGAGLSFAAM